MLLLGPATSVAGADRQHRGSVFPQILPDIEEDEFHVLVPPRSELEMCEQHGRALSNGVEAALQTNARPVRGPLSMALDEVVLEFAEPPAREQLETEAQSKNKW